MRVTFSEMTKARRNAQSQGNIKRIVGRSMQYRKAAADAVTAEILKRAQERMARRRRA